MDMMFNICQRNWNLIQLQFANNQIQHWLLRIYNYSLCNPGMNTLIFILIFNKWLCNNDKKISLNRHQVYKNKKSFSFIPILQMVSNFIPGHYEFGWTFFLIGSPVCHNLLEIKYFPGKCFTKGLIVQSIYWNNFL